MKKKLSVLLVCALLCLILGGCAFDGKKTAVTVSGTDIDEEIYNYYYDEVNKRPADYGLGEDPSSSELKDAAVNQCVRYLAFNTYFAQEGLSLSVPDKVTIADNVNNFWLRGENHYKKIGVSKPTLTKIFTSEAYKDAIFTYLYDKGTEDTEAEGQVKAYFYSSYISFRNICAYFTSDDSAGKLTEQERLDLVNSFSLIAAASGTDSEGFTSACADAGYVASGTVVLAKGSEGYPEGFYESVNMMAPGEVKVLQYDDCVFAVRKESLTDLGDGLYSGYRDTCIKEMHAAEWEAFVEDYVSTFTVE